MRWLDGDIPDEMKFFSKEREVRYDEEGKYREFVESSINNPVNMYK